MKISITLFAILTILLSSPKKCQDLRTGNYYTLNDDGSKIHIERNEGFQTESHEDGTNISRLKVKWVSECEYYLYDKEQLKGEDNMPSEMKNDTLSITITEITDSSYLTRCKLVIHGFEIQQEVMFEE